MSAMPESSQDDYPRAPDTPSIHPNLELRLAAIERSLAHIARKIEEYEPLAQYARSKLDRGSVFRRNHAPSQDQ